MARKELLARVPEIWRRLDVNGILSRFFKVIDSEFDYVHDKISDLFDLRNVDRIPDKYLHLLSKLVGHKWRLNKDRHWNRNRTRDSIRRHSYKGTISNVRDIVRENNGTYIDVDDMASHLVVLGSQGRLGCDDAAIIAADYWHNGAYVLKCIIEYETDLEQLREDLTEIRPAGTRWYLDLFPSPEIYPDQTECIIVPVGICFIANTLEEALGETQNPPLSYFSGADDFCWSIRGETVNTAFITIDSSIPVNLTSVNVDITVTDTEALLQRDSYIT